MGDGGLSRGRSVLLAVGGFVAAGAVAAPLTWVAGDEIDVRPSATASSVPQALDVEVLAVTARPAEVGVLDVTLRNAGAPVRIASARIDGTGGYEPWDNGSAIGLGVDDGATLQVSLLPTCSAGVGTPRRPLLFLDLLGVSGTQRTVQVPLAERGIPDVLLGRCDAPLGEGARVRAQVLRPQSGGDLRLRLTLVAGTGVLWVDGLLNRAGLSFSGLTAPPFVIAAGTSRVLDLEANITDCTLLAQTGDPLDLVVSLRREPDAQGPALSVADAGGDAYRRAVAAAVARACA